MRLIERYAIAVSEYLPKEVHEDVRLELLSNIEDMLPENPTEEEERNILKKLGNPRKLANEYREGKRYLISPDLFGAYMMVLRYAAIIIAIATLAGGLAGAIFEPSQNGENFKITVSLITELIYSVINETLAGLFVLTAIFYIIERTNKKESISTFYHNFWSVDNLPNVFRSDKRKISRSETIVSLVFGSFFTVLLMKGAYLIGAVNATSEGAYEITPVFQLDQLSKYTPVLLILLGIEFILSAWKLISRYWNVPLAIGNTIQNVIVYVVLWLMAYDKQLWNKEIYQFSRFVEISAEKIEQGWSTGVVIFLVIVGIITIWDCVDGFLKSFK